MLARCEKLHPSEITHRNVKYSSHWGKCLMLPQMVKYKLPYNPATPSYRPKDTKELKTCNWMFLATWLILAKKRESACPSTHEWINVVCVHNKILVAKCTHATTQMNLDNTMLSKISPWQTAINSMILVTGNVQNRQIQGQTTGCQEMRRGGIGSSC